MVDLENFEAVEALLVDKQFDCIICADVLEHIRFPFTIVELLAEHLRDEGRILVSIPNLGHWQLFWNLLRQKFPRRSRGIYDDTHLVFFMKNNLEDLCPEGYSVSILQRNFRFKESGPCILDRVLRRVICYIPWLREFFVFQYIVALTKLEKSS